MARLFDSFQCLTQTSAVVSGPPFTCAAWINIARTTAGNMTIWALTKTGDSSSRFSLEVRNSVPTLVTFANGAGTAVSSSGGVIGLNTWIHVVGIWTSSTSRALYVNGTSVGTDTTSIVPGTMGQTVIGGLDFVGSAAFVGQIARLAVWSIALSGSDITTLSTPYWLPSLVQYASLASFPPMIPR